MPKNLISSKMRVFLKKTVLFAIKKQKIAFLGIFYIIFAVVNTFSAEAFLKFGEDFVKFIPSLNAHISANFDF